MMSAGKECNKCNTPLKGYCIAYPRHSCVCENRKMKTCSKLQSPQQWAVMINLLVGIEYETTKRKAFNISQRIRHAAADRQPRKMV